MEDLLYDKMQNRQYLTSFSKSIKRKLKIHTSTPAPTPTLTATPAPTAVPPYAGWTESEYFTPLLIAFLVISVILIIVIIIIIIHYRLRKKTNTVYAQDEESKDENHTGTAIVKKVYSLHRTYDNPF